MAQENCLQKFKLPEPALCNGGILQVELLGRVQRQEMDGLYYIFISHVQVVGRPLLPRFDIEMLDSTGRCALKYMPETENSMLSSASAIRKNGASSFRTVLSSPNLHCKINTERHKRLGTNDFEFATSCRGSWC